MDLANDFVSQFVKGLDNFLLIEAAGEFMRSAPVTDKGPQPSRRIPP
jgi:hypothetical protein